MIELNNVSYSYKSPVQPIHAVKGITAQIAPGEVTAVIGHTGSGKSTLMELAAGIIKPDSGSVAIDGEAAAPNKAGFVFQYPEYQLFAETVYDDIAFGPMNSGCSDDKVKKRVKEAARKTRLTDDILKKSPFELSGGQKRMAALAGILAMNRDILIMDEPAAGLDPSGRQRIFSIIRHLLKAKPDMTIIFVTHSMEDAAEFADKILVLDKGKLILSGTPEEVFSNKETLTDCGLDIPEMMKLSDELLKYGIDIGSTVSVDAACKAVIDMYNKS